MAVIMDHVSFLKISSKSRARLKDIRTHLYYHSIVLYVLYPQTDTHTDTHTSSEILLGMYSVQGTVLQHREIQR